jgi:ribosome maturation factor RimP
MALSGHFFFDPVFERTMSSSSFLNSIRKMAEDISAREGCYLYDLEFIGAGNGRTLRVYIDKDAEGGVSLDDCSNVSRGLNQLLDAEEDLIPGGQYHLEVSSPGLERVLKEDRHFAKALGKKISVKSFAPLVQFNPQLPELDKAKLVVGTLLSFDGQGLKVQQDGKDVFVPADAIAKAHIVFDFTDSSEDQKGSKGKGLKNPHKKEKANKS